MATGEPAPDQCQLRCRQTVAKCDCERRQHGADAFRPGGLVACQLAAQEVTVDTGKAVARERDLGGAARIKIAQGVALDEGAHDVEGVEKVPGRIVRDPSGEDVRGFWR